MTYHVAREGEDQPVCGSSQRGDVVVPWGEAMHTDGRHFNCVDCHKALTGGQRHSIPEDDQ